jgi:hypothetical protein
MDVCIRAEEAYLEGTMHPISKIKYFSFNTFGLDTSWSESRNSSVGIALGYGLDDWGSRVRFPAGAGIFFSTTASRTALGPAQPHIKWVPGSLSLGVKMPEREVDHSPPSSAEVNECVELYLYSPIRYSWRGTQLKAQGQLYVHITTLTVVCNDTRRSLGSNEPLCVVFHLVTELTWCKYRYLRINNV